MPEAHASPDFLPDRDPDRRISIARRTGNLLADGTLPQAERRAAELLALRLAEDALERVRRELSLAVRHSHYLPRDLALKLARDVDSVACPFLEVTDVFSDADWRDLIDTLSRSARLAVANRTSLSEAIVVCLLRQGDTAVADAVLDNAMAPVTEAVCDTLVDEFRAQTWILDKLAARDGLEPAIVAKLVVHVSEAARSALTDRFHVADHIAPIVVEAETAALLKTLDGPHAELLLGPVRTLHAAGRLSPHLMLTGLRDRKTAFLEAALAVTADAPLHRVRETLYEGDRQATAGLMRRAGLPDPLLVDFVTEIDALREELR